MCELLSCVQLFVTPWIVAHQAPLSMEFSRQEYWSGLPFPSPYLHIYIHILASQVALVVKNLPVNAGNIRDTGSISGSERSLEEGMTTHSSVLAWRIPWTEEPGGLQSIGLQRVGHNGSDLTQADIYIHINNYVDIYAYI